MKKNLRTGLVLAALIAAPMILLTTAAQAGFVFGGSSSPSIEVKTWYRDRDGDGFGDPSTTRKSNFKKDGWVLNDDDCDDYDPFIAGGGSCI